jgi:Holliday junction resolvase RusA-like endonuclease
MLDREDDELVRGESLYVNVAGIPRPQPRPRMIPAGRGKLRIVGTADKKATLWRDAVQKALGEAAERAGWKPDAWGYDLAVVFRLEGQATGKPDLDNLVKLVMDAMQAAGVFGKSNDPDALVLSLKASKIKAPSAGNLGCTIHLTRAVECELVLDGLSGLS